MGPRKISIEEAITLANQSVIDGDVDAARHMYLKILHSAPGHQVATNALKDLPASGNDFSGSGEGFRRDMELLMSLYATGQHDIALPEAIRMQGQYPQQPMPLNVRGGILLAQGQFDDAVKVLRAAHDLAPDYDSVLRNLGIALDRTGNSEEAVVYLNKALALKPQDSTALGYLGNALLDLNRASEAKACFKKSLELQPRNADVQYMYAKLLRREGSNKEAVIHLQRALEIEPSMLIAQIEHGHTLIDLKLYRSALSELSKTIKTSPDSPDAHYFNGMAHFYLGDKVAAASSFKSSLDLNPELSSARHFLAVVEGIVEDAAPEGYVKGIFDNYAGRFEKSLVDDLGYDGPKVLRSLFDQANGPAENNTIDMGCGTGLSGAAFSDVSVDLVGIDLSESMLELARSKNIYSRLVCADIIETLEAEGDCYSLFLAADVLVYTGWLRSFFAAVRKRSARDAIFAFSTEHLETGDVQLRDSGRYAHSHEYVKSVAEDFGFEVRAFSQSPLRKEQQEWIEGGYYLLQLR